MWHLCEKKRTGELMNVDARSLEDAGQRNGDSLDIIPLRGNEDWASNEHPDDVNRPIWSDFKMFGTKTLSCSCLWLSRFPLSVLLWSSCGFKPPDLSPTSITLNVKLWSQRTDTSNIAPERHDKWVPCPLGAVGPIVVQLLGWFPKLLRKRALKQQRSVNSRPNMWQYMCLAARVAFRSWCWHPRAFQVVAY